MACKVSGASWGGVAFLSPSGDLVENLTFGLGESAAAELTRSAWVQDLLRSAVGQRGPLCVEGTELPAGPEGVPTAGSALVLPLSRPGRFRGALYLVRGEADPAFTAEAVDLVSPIAACLEEGNLYEETHLLAQLRLLNQVAQAAAGNLNLEPLLAVALRELDRHLPMSVCAVWLVEERKRGQGDDGREGGRPQEEPSLVLAAVSSAQQDSARDLGLLPGRALPLSQTPFGPCWQDGGAVYAEWARPERMQAAWAAGQPPVAEGRPSLPGAWPTFATPLRAGDRTVGVLQSVCNRPSGFSSEQVQLMYLVADLLGPAISNCQLFGRLRTTYEELRATQQELIRSEKVRALGELASGMAHDFNNSLCGVLGFLEVTLGDDSLNAASRGQLEMARTCALDAAQTVRRVQDFARTRRNDMTSQAVDANALLRETVELTRPRWESLALARGGPVALELSTEATHPLLGNPAELREVLTNLIFNAVDAMPRGGTLTARTWSSAEGVFLRVSDTGVGMGPAVRQRLFEPFFTTKGESGNGMGLSVAFGIVKQHGGEIEVDSVVGQGSSFTLRLPPAAGPLAVKPVAPPLTSAAPVSPAPDPAGSPGLRVLVVEDEPPICRLLETILTQLGHRPSVLRSGGEAVKTLAVDRFDLVLTDLGLPDLSGEEVARAVARLAPGTPVVLLTGWADQLTADAREVPGVTRVLGKPVTIKCLTETLALFAPR